MSGEYYRLLRRRAERFLARAVRDLEESCKANHTIILNLKYNYSIAYVNSCSPI